MADLGQRPRHHTMDRHGMHGSDTYHPYRMERTPGSGHKLAHMALLSRIPPGHHLAMLLTGRRQDGCMRYPGGSYIHRCMPLLRHAMDSGSRSPLCRGYSHTCSHGFGTECANNGGTPCMEIVGDMVLHPCLCRIAADFAQSALTTHNFFAHPPFQKNITGSISMTGLREGSILPPGFLPGTILTMTSPGN